MGEITRDFTTNKALVCGCCFSGDAAAIPNALNKRFDVSYYHCVFVSGSHNKSTDDRAREHMRRFTL